MADSYLVISLVMPHSILTEKLSRRGYHLSREYGVDPLETVIVAEVMTEVSQESQQRIAAMPKVFAYSDETCRAVAEAMATSGLLTMTVVDRETGRNSWRCRSAGRTTALCAAGVGTERRVCAGWATVSFCYLSRQSASENGMKTEKATFGAGCFWGVEAAFAAIPGVLATAVGYEGGKLDNPTYQDVCTDETGHAEVVDLDFDPEKASYEQLLDAFFNLHDPTTMNRQGPDWGTQYRSAIFFHSPGQETQANAKIERLTAEGRSKPKRVVTKVEPAQTFWRAEEYHQKYLEKRGQASCHI